MDSPQDAESPDPLLEACMKELQISTERFRAGLVEFPHTFQLQQQDELLADRLNSVRDNIESVLNVGYETSVETARARNLLAYIYFRLQRPSDALRQIEDVLTLEDQHKNIVALANKAVILWYQKQKHRAQEVVRALENMRTEVPEFPYLMVMAKAELAFTYTKFGTTFYPLALQLFSEVIQDAKEPDVNLWKFGLALTRRRIKQQENCAGSPNQEEYLDFLHLFCDIVHSNASDSLKAKAYAEIGLVLFMPKSKDISKTLEAEAKMTVVEACENALRLDDTDNSVLWKCGKLYRYRRKTDESCHLLERAVSKRPTSKGYHHLGLTYKALAQREKAKLKGEIAVSDTDIVEEKMFSIFQRQHSRSASSMSQCDQNSQQISSTAPDLSPAAGLSEDTVHTDGSKSCSSMPVDDTNQPQDKSVREDFHLWKMAKSPLKTEVQFCKDDRYIPEAVASLKQAVAISKGENAAAVYDLALLYRNMEMLEEARCLLENSLSKEHCLRFLNKINFLEQLGFTLADLAQKQSCDSEKQKLSNNSRSMLLMALKTASEFYSKQPVVESIWQSFHVLMEAVKQADHSQAVKLREQATLFRMIRKSRESLALLQDIEKLLPHQANDPEHLKLCIENYVELEQFEEALTFVELLQCTSQRERAMVLFEDNRFLHKVYVQAAKQSFLRGIGSFKSHFRAVFNDFDTRNELSSSSEETATSDERTGPVWDVHILHEEENRELAEALVTVLSSVCGLKVTRMDDDIMGGFDLDVLKIMMKSKVVVVIAATRKFSRELHYFINFAARRRSTVTLVVDGGHLPRKLKTHRSLELPSELLHATSKQDGEEFSQYKINAICKLFALLVDLDLDQF